MKATRTEVETAYRKLKSYVYYDKTDLPLRARLAKFECSDKFEEALRAVQEVADCASPERNNRFKSWLKQISFRVVPKKLKPMNSKSSTKGTHAGKFITNVTSAKKIFVEKVNYFFDGPIELHLIAVLWLMRDGRILDSQLLSECCGSRLSPVLHEEGENSLQLFTKYHEQYSRWRDSGIRKAKQLLVEEHRNVAILGLDLQEYFYRVDIDFDKVRETLINSEQYDADSSLLACIEAIGSTYRKRIAPLMSATHPALPERTEGLPIGLCSSLVLANWCLHAFDKAVLAEVRPAYYGRYVDDILLIVPTSEDIAGKRGDPIAAFMQGMLVKTGLLTPAREGAYSLTAHPNLRLQQSKCILQYFDARHSIAGLEKFKKKLEQNASDFRLLPVEEADNSLEDVAYELLYEGSANKFRSVNGMAENRYELAKHLARQTVLHLVSDDPPDHRFSEGLKKFFKGRNAIEYFDLWERVLTLFCVSGDMKTRQSFIEQLRAEMGRVHFLTGEPLLQGASNEVKESLRSGLVRYLEIAAAMSDAVCNDNKGPAAVSVDATTEELCDANMLRHHFVRAPLLNFLDYDGPLGARSLKKKARLDKRKLKLTPRFVNFDECMLLAYSDNVEIGRLPPFEFASKVFKQANRRLPEGVKWGALTTDTRTPQATEAGR